MMKSLRFVLFFMVVVATVACSGSKKKGEITFQGILKPGVDYEKVFVRRLDRERTVVAESLVNDDGSFAFSFEAERAGFYQMDFPDKSFLYFILRPGESVKVVVSALPPREHVTVEGSLFTEQFLALGNKLRPFEIKSDSLNRAYRALPSEEERDRRRAEFAALGEKWEEAQKSLVRQFVTENPGSLSNLLFLNRLDIKKELDLFKKVAQKLKEEFPENVYVEELNYTVTAESTMRPGMPAPDFELSTPDGEKVKVSDYRGKYLLLDFWASWCGPCRKENPKVRSLYEDFHEKGFDILGVSLDNNKDKWLQAIDEDGLKWKQVSDLKKWDAAPAKLYAVRSIPHTVLIDPEGKIIAVKLRGNELRVKLQELLGQ